MKPLIEIINNYTHESKIGKALLGLTASTLIYTGTLGLLEKVYAQEDKNNISIVKNDIESYKETAVIKNGIEHYIQTDKDTYSLGEDIKITYRITNLRNEDANFFFPTTKQYDFLVEKRIEALIQLPQTENIGPVCPIGDKFTKIWRWSDDKFFAQIITNLVLSPNESKEFSEIWPQIDDKGTRIKIDNNFNTGTYKISGILPYFGSDDTSTMVNKYITIAKESTK